MSEYVLKLFVSSGNPGHRRAAERLRQMCADPATTECTLEVIDVLQHPEIAERDKVMAIPTLIRISPGPTHRIIGDVTAVEEVFAALGLRANEYVPAEMESQESESNGR